MRYNFVWCCCIDWDRTTNRCCKEDVCEKIKETHDVDVEIKEHAICVAFVTCMRKRENFDIIVVLKTIVDDATNVSKDVKFAKEVDLSFFA